MGIVLVLVVKSVSRSAGPSVARGVVVQTLAINVRLVLGAALATILGQSFSAPSLEVPFHLSYMVDHSFIRQAQGNVIARAVVTYRTELLGSRRARH